MQVSTLGDITNAESQSLQVVLAIQDDATKAGADSFGDGKKEYTTDINIQFAQGQALFSRIENGAFDQHSVAPRSEIEFPANIQIVAGNYGWRTISGVFPHEPGKPQSRYKLPGSVTLLKEK